MKNVYLLIFLFTFLSFPSFAEEVEEDGVIKKTNNFFKEQYDGFIKITDSISERKEVVKAKEIVEFVFLGKNPIFQDYNNLVSLSYLRSNGAGDNLNAIMGSYSVPTQLFMNGRSSAQIGGFIGDVSYSGATTNSNQNVSQVIGGFMHEFVFNFNYFYCTAGLGIFIRNIDSDTTLGDRIGSRFTFSEKFAIGKSFDRFNIEFFYRHFSNGGLTEVNRGYNFFGFELGFKF